MEEKNKEVEIDLLELASKLWNHKKFIIKAILIGLVLGLIIAFSIPKEYTSMVVFTTTNNNNSQSGNMGVLASLAGVNINSMSFSDALSSDLYPDIIGSTSFVQGLLKVNVRDRHQGIDTTLYKYLLDYQKEGWYSYLVKAPFMLLNLINKSDKELNVDDISPYFISKEELGVINDLKELYEINTDKKTGVTTFKIASQSPAISAFLADTITSYLQSYIIEERTKKAKMDLANSKKIYEQAKEDYDKAQLRLALFVDRNKNIISESFKLNQRKLEYEANLSYNVYNQMAQQVQVGEMKVQDDTPIFTIIQPSIEPIKPSKPSKMLILIGCVFLVALGSSCWILRTDLRNIILGDNTIPRG